MDLDLLRTSGSVHKNDPRITSVIKQPPHINGAFGLFLLELKTGFHQLLIHFGNLWRWRATHRHWERERKGERYESNSRREYNSL